MDGHEVEDIVAVVFLDIAIIVVAARLLGIVARRLRQPGVVAEIMAALILGPSVLGTLPGNPTEVLFPTEVRPFLTVVAALGLIIFMFVVGLELDLGLIKGQGRTAGIVSVSSIVLPFGLGALLALWLHQRHDTAGGQDVELLPFVLFIGAAMSVTAFPVLARILSERGMHRTPTGSLALACAAVDDVLAWALLAGVLAVLQSSGPGDLIEMLVLSVGFVVVMLTVVRPRLRVLVSHRTAAARLTPDVFAVVLVGILVSSFITDRIGIHAIFGAFLFGAAMPRAGAEKLTHEILERVEQVTVLLLLPVFFVATGLNVDVGALGRWGLLELGAVMLVACAGKFLGAMLAAKAVGVPTRRSAAIGTLMNTRGLTELVILNIGLASDVLDRELFTVMVLMAIGTTVMTEPLLRVIYPDRAVARDIAEAERAALGLPVEHRVVAVVEPGHPSRATDVVDVGVGLLGRQPSSQLLISSYESPPGPLELGSGLTARLAAVADSFELTQTLSERARERGVEVAVRAQLSADPASDLTALVDTVRPDALVVWGEESEGGVVVGQGVDCTLVRVLAPSVDHVVANGVVRLGPTTVVSVRCGAGADGLAAVEQAVRLATAFEAPLSLATGGDRRERRRCSVLSRKLEAAGMRLSTHGHEGNGGAAGVVVVVGRSEWATTRAGADPEGIRATPLLIVQAPEGAHGEGLTALLARMTESSQV